MEQETPSFFIQKITFKDGTIIELKKDDIVIFVGANNVGKSRTLKDIKDDIINESKNKKIISDIEYKADNMTEKSIRNYFEKNFKKDMYNNYSVQLDYNNTYCFNEDNFQNIRNNEKNFFKVFFTMLSTENRLNITLPILYNNINDYFRLNIMNSLESSDEKINRLNNFLIRDFGKAIDVDQDSTQNTFSKMYKMGIEDEIRETINSTRRLANRKLKELENLHEQGDGIRSAVAILAALIVNEHSLFLIDEPEAFLHPPQARLLGNNIVELSESKQFFVATHNIDLIRGILEKNSSRVKIIKINRDNNNNTIFELNNQDIEKIANDRNLKYTNILNGLFYSKVILCENESDCKFYSAILENLNENLFQNSLFCAVGGKDQFKVIIPLLKSLKIDYTVIADIDLINNIDKLKQLLNAIEKNKYDKIQKIHKRFLDEFQNKNDSLVKKQSTIKEEINNLFTKEEYMSDETARKIKGVLKNINSLKLLKTGGRDILPQGSCVSDFNEIEKYLNLNNIYILDCGEIERLIPEIDLHGNAWVEGVFNKYSDINNAVFDKAKKFIKKVFNITN